jgi:apolipoprotein N-acyltransferase
VKALWPWLAAILSGLLAAAAFPPFDQTWSIWIALVPLTLAILFSNQPGRRRWLRDFGLGYAAGLAFFWTCFFWITTVTILGWFALQFYMAIYFGLWGLFCGMMRMQIGRGEGSNSRWAQMLVQAQRAPTPSNSPWLKSGHNLCFAAVLAAGWTGLEWLRGWLMSGFGWNGLGVALHATWPMIQIAEYTGIAGITFIVAFCNAILSATAARLWNEIQARVMRPHFDLTISLVGVVGLFVFGLNQSQHQQARRALRVALVQANVARAEKFDLRYKQNIFDKFQQLSRLGLITAGRVDLLVWPESAMPAPVLEDEETYDFVASISNAARVDLLLGAIEEEPGRVYNAAILFRPGGQPQLYRKIHLVPFGEYVPFRHSFPLFARIVGDQVPEDFDAGHEFTVFELSENRGRVAPLICFEDTIGELTRQFVVRGADLLCTVTNDGWFLRSAGSQQHLANAVFRCVETRRPMIRAANTGVTCFINDAGRLTQILRDDTGSTFGEGTLVGDVNIAADAPLTFYTRHGDLFAEICALFASLILLAKFVAAVARWRNSAH